MNLIIRLKDGNPIDHPMIISNFQKAYPNIDINNLPDEFAFFKRVSSPKLGIYEKDQTVSYELVDGIYQDVWRSEPMTPEEILEKQNIVKNKWQTNGGYPSWVFDENKCKFVPPVSYPEDQKEYIWDELSMGWVEKLKVDITNQI